MRGNQAKRNEANLFDRGPSKTARKNKYNPTIPSELGKILKPYQYQALLAAAESLKSQSK